MYDKSLIWDALDNIEHSLKDILEWSAQITSVDDFLTSSSGMILLNAICMKLFSVGEEIKSIDKRTDKQLFPLYPAINWSEAMKMRDIIAHHYFELDADVVFDTLQHDVQPLLRTIIQIKDELER
ncbi:MAG: hypothetical protein EZS26_002231 [Candidatus Ordinivivax streblomastigis]|uniref:DUF86 domain-containing protein n=1 Tax=Candidatus Ordinivivax streblomastigis TaxID=2540710 RepID=A0A5M8NZN3_9BACT|nr:MAG: hypothetical protein EZS26_002231 [Candidatus Ordinivivax streblomastigis]